MSRFYYETFKWKLYGMHMDGCNYTELSRKFSVSDTALLTWFSQIKSVLSLHNKSQTVGAMVEQVTLLKKQIKLFATEKSILHKSELIQKVPKENRIQAAQVLVPAYGPNIVCRMLDLQKSNFYYHTAYLPKKTLYEKRDDVLIPNITEILQQHAYST